MLLSTGAPSVLSAQATDAKDEETIPREILFKARKALIDRHPQEAISDHIDKAITFYEAKYKNEKRKIYCTRNSTENLYYLLMSAEKKQDAVAHMCLWADAHYMKAYALLELGKLQDAKKSLQNALELAPRNSQYLSELGHCYQLEKNWAKMLEQFELAEESANCTSPDDQKASDLSRALRGQGYALIEIGKLDDAELKYLECIKINHNDKSAQNGLNYIKQQRAEIPSK